MKILSHFFQRKTVWKLTWFGRLSTVLLLSVLIFLGWRIWLNWSTSFITARDTACKSDVVLIEGWKYPHNSIIRASLELQAQGLAKYLVFVEYLPSHINSITDLEFPRYYHEMLDLYFKSEGIDPQHVKRIPVELKDPVTWNTALAVTDALAAQGYRSMILATPWYHSRRSCDAYTIAGKLKGINVTCKPVEGGLNKHNWWKSHVGMSMIFGEVVKRIYYIFRIT